MAQEHQANHGNQPMSWAQRFAFLLCLVFALIGAIPLAFGALVRTAFVQRWAAAETSRVLHDQLKIDATYSVEIKPWPLTLALGDLVVKSTDGHGPFATVERVTVRPGFFSLLGGRLDAGDVELTGVNVRAVVRDGSLANLALQTPKSKSSGPPELPFSSVSVTDADVDLDLDGTVIAVRELDVDVARAEGAFEASLRVGGAEVVRRRPFVGRPNEEAIDEDTLCHLEARARIEPHEIVIRRLYLLASMDFDPDPGTRPSCDLDPEDWRRLDVQLAGTRVSLDDTGGFRSIEGRVHAQVPVALAHRLVDLVAATGSVRLDAEVGYAVGDKLPAVHGDLTVLSAGLDGKVFAKRVEGKLAVGDGTVVLSSATAAWGNGDFTIPSVTVWPFVKGVPLEARDVVGTNVNLQGLLRDLGAHPQSHVGWTLTHTSVPRFGGTLDPLLLEGKLAADTRDFGIYDRPANRADRRRMITVSGGTVDGTLAINDHEVELRAMHAVTPRSNLTATVHLGYLDQFGLDVAAGSRVDLGEISPLAAVQIGGQATLEAHGTGTSSHPRIEGSLAVKGFSIGGFEAGDIVHAKADFTPLVLDLSAVELRKGASAVTSSSTRVDFQSGADVLVDADVDTNTKEGLAIKDFFDVFKFTGDPRFASISGVSRGTAKVHYVVGGKDDRCGGGAVRVRLVSSFERPALFGEQYDSGALDVNVDWDDRDAGSDGMNVDVYSASLKDGAGSILAQAEVRHGGTLRGNVVASGFPLGRLEELGALGKSLDGEASAIGTLGGTLDRLSAHLDVTFTPLRVGLGTLPGSHFGVDIEPDPTPPRRVATSRCENPIGPPFLMSEYDKDLPDGKFRVNGTLFDGQVHLDDVTMTRQRAEIIAGNVTLSKLDIGRLADLLPKAAFANVPPEGKLSARISMDHLQPSALSATKAEIHLDDLHLSQGPRSVDLDDSPEAITIADDTLTTPEIKLSLKQAGLSIGVTAHGVVSNLSTSPIVDAEAAIAPIDLSNLKSSLDAVDRIAGTLSGSVSMKGALLAPVVTGDIKLRDGALAIPGLPVALDNAMVDVSVGGGEVRIVRASANVGAGTLDITGRAPLVGLTVGAATANITARNVKIPIDDGIDVTVGADLVATYKPDANGGKSLPDVQGTVSLSSFAYTRPIALNLNLTELSKSLKRTDVDTYDPALDLVSFDLNVVSPKPLRVENDLVAMKLEVGDRGIQISGTNQRFGARGSLRILPESKLRLRNHEFDVREGYVRFEDPTKIRAEVDVRAVTEFRRTGSVSDTSAGTTAASGGGTTNGQWDIAIRAHGPSDDLKLDLSSDPPLDQEDIVLLLTIGMTRAEIDRGLASSLGETVGLEALSALTGADKAVQSIVPIIDYFHFGSSYSSHTGQTEPNVTVGKRISDDVSASVTTTLTEREVGATLEWRLKKGMSVETSYDNTSQVNSTIGNLGADIRWHLEFE